jgi:hypothetical protein
MSNKIQTIKDAQDQRDSQLTNFTVRMVLAVALSIIAFIGGHNLTTILLLAIGVYFWIAKIKIAEQWEKAIEIISFSQQTLNLYVYARHPNDYSVLQRKEFAVSMLQAHNPHEVTVWLIDFRSPVVWGYTAYKEKVETVFVERQEIAAGESWEQFQEYLKWFIASDTDQRKRLLAKKSTAKQMPDDWYNQFVQNQKKEQN